MSDLDQWGRPIGGSSGGIDQWGRPIHVSAPSGGGGGGSSGGSSVPSKGLVGAGRYGVYTTQQIQPRDSHGIFITLGKELAALPVALPLGLYSTGKAYAISAKQNPLGFAIGSLTAGPLWGGITGFEAQSHAQHHDTEFDKKVIKPQIEYYDWKYGPGIRHGQWDVTWKRMQQEPLGTLLDIGTVASGPAALETGAIKGLSGLARVSRVAGGVDEQGMLIEAGARGALNRVATSAARGAEKIQTGRVGPFGLFGKGDTVLRDYSVKGVDRWGRKYDTKTQFPVTARRPRNMLGRLVYEPTREWFARNANAAGLTGAGDTARLLRQLEDLHGQGVSVNPDLMRHAEFRMNRLSEPEQYALPHAAMFEYETPEGQIRTGLDATMAAPKGAPREQIRDFLLARLNTDRRTLGHFQATGQDLGHQRLLQNTILRTMNGLKELGEGNAKRQAEIDQALKHPSKQMVKAFKAFKKLQEDRNRILVERGRETPEGQAELAAKPADIMRETPKTVQEKIVEHQQAIETTAARKGEHGAARRKQGEARTHLKDVQQRVLDLQRQLGLHDKAQADRIKTLETAYHKAQRGAAATQGRVARLQAQYDSAKGFEKRGELRKQLQAAKGGMNAASKAERKAFDELERERNRATRVDRRDARKEITGELTSARARQATAVKQMKQASEDVARRLRSLDASRVAQKEAKLALKREEVRVKQDRDEAERLVSEISGFGFPLRDPALSISDTGEEVLKGRPITPYVASPPMASDMTGAPIMTRRFLSDPRAWLHEYVDAARLDVLDEWHKILTTTGVAKRYDRSLGKPPLPGYVAINPEGKRMHPAFGGAASATQATARHVEPVDVDAGVDEWLHPNPVDYEQAQIWQIPKGLHERMTRDMSQAKGVARFIDSAINAWKALTLKYRPAWVVNNILGQHILYALFNGGMKNYIYSLNPQRRRELAEYIDGVHTRGTTELVNAGRPWITKQYGWSIKRGDWSKFGGVPPGHGKWSHFQPRKAIEGFGDLMVRLNQEVADNQPRTAYAIKLLRERQRSIRNLEIANDKMASLFKENKSIEEVAAGLSNEQKVQLVREINTALGDFRHAGKFLRGAFPFASWFRVILTISKDLALDHPDKLLLIWNMEMAAFQDEDTMMPFPTPSWLDGSLKVGAATDGIQGAITTQGLNPFATVAQLASQLMGRTSYETDSKGNVKPASGPDSPFASASPIFQMLQVLGGVDPFTGEAYAGPFDKTPLGPVLAAGGYPIINLPQVRLLQQLGVLGGYREPKTYQPTKNAAVLSFVGLPYRNVRIEQAKKYAGIYP